MTRHHDKHRHGWRWPRAAALGLLLSSTSCSSVNQYVKNTFPGGSQADAVAEAEKQKQGSDKVQHAYTAAKPGKVKVDPLQHSASPPGETQSGDRQKGTGSVTQNDASSPKPRQTAEQALQQAEAMARLSRGEDPFASFASTAQVSQASAEVNVSEQESPAVTSMPPIRRAALQEEHPNSALCPPVESACPPGGYVARPFPRFEISDDEYVRDGGDKGLPVHYEGSNRAGLELEDTVAEFKDDEGKFHVKPSTEAVIYAPRFGEVRSATLPQQDQSVVKAQGHQDQQKVAGLNTKTVTAEETQTDEVKGMQTRSRAGGLNARISDEQLDKAIAAGNHVKLINVYEEIQFIQEGTFNKVSSAVLQECIAAAQEWADGRRPIIIAQDQSGQVLQGRFAAQDYTGVEDRRTPGDLKLVKVADKAFAHPGEIVTFTIRFDNVGGRDLLKVRVVDNLSPRLEYIEGSINSNLDGKVDAADNGSGSKLLTFEFDEPLKGNTGGFVSFQCRVR